MFLREYNNAASTILRISLQLFKLHAQQGDWKSAQKVIESIYRLAAQVLTLDHPLMSEVDAAIARVNIANADHEWALWWLLSATARDSRTVTHQLAVGSSKQRSCLVDSGRHYLKSCSASPDGLIEDPSAASKMKSLFAEGRMQHGVQDSRGALARRL